MSLVKKRKSETSPWQMNVHSMPRKSLHPTTTGLNWYAFANSRSRGYMCLPCSVKFLDVDSRLEGRVKTCQNWLNNLPYKYTGCAMNGEDTYSWAGEK